MFNIATWSRTMLSFSDAFHIYMRTASGSPAMCGLTALLNVS